MAAEVEEIYPFEDGLPRNHINPAADKFNKNNGQYPTTLTLHPKYKDIGSTFPILSPLNLAPSIEPLRLEDIGNAPTAQFYHIAIKYDNTVDENTLVCRGFAKTS